MFFKSYLSFKHHYCCYFFLKERFLKFEILLFAFFENLLTFVAIAFIFYYQTIIFESMFSFYQIDLSSKSTSFFNILNVSFSLIMFSIVWYIIFIIAFESSEALHFNKQNITKFLKRFEKQCDEYEIIEKKHWIKLSCYCIRLIANIIKILFSYINRSWNVFEKKIKKKYKN